MHNKSWQAGSKDRPPMLGRRKIIHRGDHVSNARSLLSQQHTAIETQYQNEVNDIRAERIAKSANPLALLTAAQQYSDNYYQAPKSQRSNAPSYMQSSSTRPMIQNPGSEDKDMKKNLALLAKYFKKLYKPTNNNLRTSSNSRNKTEDTTPRYNNDNQSGQFGNQRTMTVAGARETVGSPVVQQNGIQCFNCKGFGHYAREFRSQSVIKTTLSQGEDDDIRKHISNSYMAKIQEVSPEESSSTGQPLEQVQKHDESNVYDNVRRHSEQPESINDTYVLKKDDSNVTPDSSYYMYK
ncbi:hypothetical protein Tco_0217244 [Tanacetum coccineum]